MTCPSCGNPSAYVGFQDVECPEPTCRNYCERLRKEIAEKNAAAMAARDHFFLSGKDWSW